MLRFIRPKAAHSITSATDTALSHTRTQFRQFCRKDQSPPVCDMLEPRQMLSVNVTTYHYSNLETGANTNETQLTLANVNPSSFGKIASLPVDGQIYGQPLIMTGVAMGDGEGTHDIVLVTTESDDVYAFDAYGNDPAQGYLWHTSLLETGETTVPESAYGTTDITPQIGITGTPVINPATDILYVVGLFRESNNTYTQRIYALNISNGSNAIAPVTITASVDGTGYDSVGGVVTFNPFRENQRPALTLANGEVYVGWSSHGDEDPWHGWIIAYNATTLHQDYVYCNTANGEEGGIWMSGGGIAVNSSGDLYVTSGNGTFDANNGKGDYGMTLEELSPSLTPLDYFAPYNEATLSDGDLDYGCSNVILLTGQTGGDPNEVLSAGKWGTIYLNDSDTGKLGEFNANGTGPNDDLGQATLEGANPNNSNVHNTMVYWNGSVYLGGDTLTLQAFSVANGKLSATPTSQTSHVFGTGEEDGQGAGLTVSSNGTSNGIVWALDNSGFLNSPAVLYAYNASNLSQTPLWTSSSAPNGRDTAGIGIKFQDPVVANGHVYVAGDGSLTIYGLLTASRNRPTVTQPATATLMNLGKNTATLSVQATDPSPDLLPVYTWTVNSNNGGATTFSINGTNTSNTTTVTLPGTGTYTFTVTIEDPNSGLTTTSSVTVSVGNVLVNNISVGVNENGVRNFNFTDFYDGYTNTATGAAMQSIKITSLPTHGKLSIFGSPVTVNEVVPDGLISNMIYTPTTGYAGPDSFGWNADDGLSFAVNPALVNIIVSAFPVLNISNATLVKPTSGSEDMDFTVTRTGDLYPNTTVNYTTVDGTAKAGVDYNATSGTLDFAQGVATQTIMVPIIGNGNFNPNLTFSVQLSNAQNNSGAGEFPGATLGTSGVDQNPIAVATGDFNGDGIPDLAVLSQTSPYQVSILLGNGNGTFQAPINYNVGSGQSSSIVAADLSNNGILDLVVTDGYGGNIAVLMGNGNGTFQAPVYYSDPYDPYSVAIGDFNNDGSPDLAVANFEPSGSGSGAVSIFLGNGDGTFQSQVCYGTGSAFGIAAGDFNGDGHTDLTYTSQNGGNGTVSILINNANGTFKAGATYNAGSYATAVTVGDFNGDSKLDLAVSNETPSSQTGTVSILVGNGDGTFQKAVNYTVGEGPTDVVVGDLNNDGKQDLAIADYLGSQVSLLVGNGNGTFQTAQNIGVGGGAYAVAIADLTNNGKNDVVVPVDAPSGYVNTLIANSTTVRPADISATGTIVSDANSVVLNGPNFLQLDPTDPNQLDIWPDSAASGTPVSYDVDQVNGIIDVGNTATVDFSNGNPVPAGISFYGTGTSSLVILGDNNSDSFNVSNGQLLISGGTGASAFTDVPINFASGTNLTIQAGTGATSLTDFGTAPIDYVAPAGGTYPTAVLSSLSIAAGATVAFTSPNASRALLQLAAISNLSGQLDLQSNDLLVHGGTSAFNTVNALVASGYSGGTWAGQGITSSSAANDSTHLTALGVILNNNDRTSFDDAPALSTDVLVKYTYCGDTNLDGTVSSTDYSRIDNGYLSNLTGWYNGDFNYDNHVNGSDYTLMDNAFNQQGAASAADIASPASQVVGDDPKARGTAANPIPILTPAPVTAGTSTETSIEDSLKQKDRLDELVATN